MKIQHVPSVDAARQSIVTLETKRERALSDAQVVALVTDCAGLHYEFRRDRYRLNGGSDAAMSTNASGEVERSGDRIVVTVFAAS
jgi:hypothetical protein